MSTPKPNPSIGASSYVPSLPPSALPSPAMAPERRADPEPMPTSTSSSGASSGSSSQETYNAGGGEVNTLGKNFGRDHPLFKDLAPEDSYSPDGVYWADLPFSARQKWINAQSNAEAKRELSHIWSMFKRDPLSPLSAYCRRYVIGGFGLFTEGYTLFSIGNLTALYAAVWPTCWGTHEICDANWIAAVTYLQIIGIIVGQILVGFEGDWVGRRFGLVQDAIIMTLGLVMLTASWGTSLNGWVICYGFSQLVYGIGVGGEYPMTSTTAMESKQVVGSQTDDKLHRGRNVVLAFLMQGWGQLFNQGVLILLLIIFHHGSGNPPYSEIAAQSTFRVSFAIMAVMTLWLAYFRYYKTTYSSRALAKSKKNSKVNQSGYDYQSLKLVSTHFSGRLIGTTTCWLFNDFLFYGNKLFASSFIKIVSPNATLIDDWLWNLLNVGVGLCGYYLAAFMIDHKSYGRKRMQTVGFLADAILFLIPAIWYNELTSPKHIAGFQTVYFLSSFFQQFGPNCTTFLLAAEVFPISVRATAHGLSAASGKLGALIPAVLFNYIGGRTRFWIVCWFGFVGCLFTQVFIPDTTGLDLREQDRYWTFVRAGNPEDYHGIAVHPRHLSLWEKWVLKRHLAYDPELDKEARVRELRAMYEERMAEGAKEEVREKSGMRKRSSEKKDKEDEESDDEDEGLMTEGARTYFTRERNEKYTTSPPAIKASGWTPMRM